MSLYAITTVRSIALILIIISPLGVIAQEVCGNGIDDDGDCNVDCMDRACGVNTFMPLNGASASFVVGQVDFTSSSSSSTDSTMFRPYDVAADPTTGKVFVSDAHNNRVLRYASYDQFLFNGKAEAVLGQTNLTNNGAGLSSTRFNKPLGIFVGPTGTLWVADWVNDRVLRFDNASNKANGAPANGVLGQPNFNSGSAGTSRSRMRNPVDMFEELDGTLWVADLGNRRVLRFDNAVSKANGANADGVLGKTNYTSSGSMASRRNLGEAAGIVIICNSLYVSDATNHRIMRWDNPQAKANGANADGVIGQANYTSSALGTSQTRLRVPRILSADSTGNLYISDADNHRMLIHYEVLSKSFLAPADVVLGQPDFTTRTTGTSATRLNTPRGQSIIQTATRTYLTVCDRENHRVMVWGPKPFQTDELTSFGANMAGSDPAATGSLTFTILQQPTLGTVTITNAATGAFTYTPSGPCPLDIDTVVTFRYSVTNGNGCSEIAETAINVLDAAICADNDKDGVDDFTDLDDDNDGIPDIREGGNTLDSDNDGVPNRFDLDSDNDGIYDVVEAGSGQAFTDGVLNGAVNPNGIPTAVDTNADGAVDYTIADSDSDGNIDSIELDSDGDLCQDVIEAGYTDTDGDGLLGPVVPPTVDDDGLVTSGGP